ncbi:hypothetical protein [Acidovorax sp. 69]|uniref:hypothetical protein n=1 Tax=Acidovorax sp. 69 TaxID=2035202 RepID=UPI001E38F89B|nr:hypothetical protein [Acidovorax sp. 69]
MDEVLPSSVVMPPGGDLPTASPAIDQASGTGPVVDHHRMAEALRHALTPLTRNGVGGTTGWH